ncbi:hypothetical protein [Bradyrhizobium japonicum]|uniref:hypothetical protein n=1 Tax=Bradyrhizobium japonicum TaxID=375 RepID=UPI001BA66301|nr:hypothetical protein [Bradyrhizobium japonicum]MBR0910823.1 hypothetical protein [Bradyrhizobium japonicum]
MATDLNEIVRIAALDALEEYVRDLERLPDRDQGLVIIARKLLVGQTYKVAAPANFDRDRVLALAQAIGAKVDISETDHGLTRVTFTPAARQ